MLKLELSVIVSKPGNPNVHLCHTRQELKRARLLLRRPHKWNSKKMGWVIFQQGGSPRWFSGNIAVMNHIKAETITIRTALLSRTLSLASISLT